MAPDGVTNFETFETFGKKPWKMKTENRCFLSFPFFSFSSLELREGLCQFSSEALPLDEDDGAGSWILDFQQSKSGSCEPANSDVQKLLCFNVTQLANHVEDLAAKSAQALSFLPLLPKSVANPCSSSNQSQLSPPHASRQALARARSRPALPFAATGDTRHTLPRSWRWTSHKNRTQNSPNFTMFHYS